MTLDQYKQIVELPVDLETTEHAIQVAAIMTGRTAKEITSLPVAEMMQVLEGIKMPQTGLSVTEFKWKNKSYQLIDSVDDLNFYQYDDMRQYMSKADFAGAFIVATFKRADYQVGAKLIEEFAARREAFADLPSDIWWSSLQDLIKKKNYQIISQVSSLATAETTQVLQSSSQIIIESLIYLQSQKPTPQVPVIFTDWCMRNVFLPFTIWVLKRLKPEARIGLANQLLKKFKSL